MIDSIDRQEGLVALNNPTTCSTNPIIFITSSELTKEFYSKEMYIEKLALVPEYKFGFFDENGQRAKDRRAIFKQFFEYENLKSIVPKIEAIVIKHLTKLKKTYWKEGTSDAHEFKRIEMEEVLLEIFSDLTTIILLGEGFKAIDIRGMRFSEAISLARVLLMEDYFSPANALSSGLIFWSRMTSKHRESTLLMKEIEEYSWKCFLDRKKQNVPPQLNIIDLLIQNDATLPEEKRWTKKDILGHFILF